jgi:putative hydroxymethylpyrimidine transport system substrate-binding protein
VARGIRVAAASPESALADYFRAVPDADRAVETAAFELTRPYFATRQKCDPVRWQAFADFAFTHGLIEKAVTVAPLLPDLGAE